ncbi:MAG: hypothetical protein COA82_01185 [Alkaliphilus sp.]|nr:hypothetical protein [Alkaliphilus sp. AH-315-G20]MBN4074408.1 hypothetical protein [bacterium AH-315-E09]PHS36608.1 MAG: hypothetical protein COA82_01185 [Alkaliphilus sp.]
MFSKKQKKNKKNEEQEQKKKTAQQWMPLADIENEFMFLKNGDIVCVLQIQPISLELLSQREKNNIIAAFSEELNGLDNSIQFFCIGRSVDLDSYLSFLNNKSQYESDFIRKQILRKFISNALEISKSGETTERRFYSLIKSKDEEEIKTKIYELQSQFVRAGLVTRVLKNDELLELVSLFTSSEMVSFEENRIDKSLAPVYMGGA